MTLPADCGVGTGAVADAVAGGDATAAGDAVLSVGVGSTDTGAAQAAATKANANSRRRLMGRVLIAIRWCRLDPAPQNIR
jgi:hypothetical protein